MTRRNRLKKLEAIFKPKEAASWGVAWELFGSAVLNALSPWPEAREAVKGLLARYESRPIGDSRFDQFVEELKPILNSRPGSGEAVAEALGNLAAKRNVD